MANPLPYVLWPVEGDPNFYQGNGVLVDGTGVELFSNAGKYAASQGWSIPNITWKMQLSKDGAVLAEHQFSVEEIKNGQSFWLIADPRMTDPNPSFSSVFAKALTQLGEGIHDLVIQNYASADGRDFALFEEGTVQFDASKGSSKYAELVGLLGDADTAREESNKEHVAKQEKEREAAAAAKHAANHFKLHLKSSQATKTSYVIIKHLRHLSEDIHAVYPNKETVLDLWRGTEYDVLVYRQDEDKKYARKVTTVNATFDNKVVIV